MKGPGIRIDLDVRRVWTCPKCGSIRRTGGEIGAVRCQCADESWMLLQELPRRRDLIPPPKSIMSEMTPADLLDQPEPPPTPAASPTPSAVSAPPAVVIVEVETTIIAVTETTVTSVSDQPPSDLPAVAGEIARPDESPPEA